MPPQPGLFPLSYPSSHKAARHGDVSDMNIPYHQHNHHSTVAGPSSRTHGGSFDDGKREKRRREIAGKLGKEMSDRRDEPRHISGRHFTESISVLHSTALQLSTRPDMMPLFNLRLLPLTTERSATLAQLEMEERYAIECAQTAYDEERERVEEEWKRGRERVRERLIEGIEDRRRRAREEKEGEGTTGDAALDSTSRPHITRKLRNKLGTSPPPTPLGAPGSALPNGTGIGAGLISSLPITTGPFLNPHSLSVDELPSPFPLPLTSTTISNGGMAGAAGGAAGGGGGGGRRRPKANGTHSSQIVGGLGKSLSMLCGCKEGETDHDLGEIRRGNKRRRATVATLTKTGNHGS